jgi:hypothetical protein
LDLPIDAERQVKGRHMFQFSRVFNGVWISKLFRASSLNKALIGQAETEFCTI